MQYNEGNSNAAGNAWHALESLEAVQRLGSNQESGLSEEEAQKRLVEFGKNRLEKKSSTGMLKILLNQFSSFLVWLLIAAAIISFFIGDEAKIDAIVIVAIIILNAVLGFRQEFKAEKAMEALQKLASTKATVIRNGKEHSIDSSELVPGDIVILREGDKVPADARIISSVNLKADESALSGESNPVEKHPEKLSAGTQVADRKNIVFANTTIVYGRGKAIVAETGMKTEFGKISWLIKAIEKEKTPLEKNIDAFGKKLGIAVIAICIVIFVAGIFSGNELKLMFFTAVSLSVAAVPEGLTAVVTITLALGMKIMAGKNALMRKMSAVETLGSTSVICSDKTGTLTKNELTVEKIFCNGKLFDVSGSGFNAEGKIFFEKKEARLEKEKELELLLQNSALCNNASFYENDSTGDPTEIALLATAKKAGIEKKELEKQFEFLSEKPFDSQRKMMSVVFAGRENSTIVFCKGSVESLLEKSTKIFAQGKEKKLEKKEYENLIAKNNELAEKGYRVLGFAFKGLFSEEKSPRKRGEMENIESELVFLGMTAMIDAPRKEALDAIQLCQKAGIEVKMITGDHLLTAIAVAKQLGIMKEGGIAITGKDLEEMSEEELEQKIEKISVFARVNPEHKLAIVNALQKKGSVVAMTGDGINDAPALKKADIGVAMGITGTEVSKEAADMIVLDDNFATIVSAVREGRRVFANIRNFVKYLLGANAAEVLLILMAIIFAFVLGKPSWALPLAPVQLLFINLITDGLPAIALGNEPAGKELMQQQPRKKKTGVLDNAIPFIIVSGIVGAIVSLAAFAIGFSESEKTGMTMAFATIILFETILAFNCRSEKNAFQISPFGNKSLVLATIASLAALALATTIPQLQIALGTVSLAPTSWAIVIMLAMPSLIIPFLEKPLKSVNPKASEKSI
ncbi:MAG: cation-translocating P-type ATPase [Candidatus ainarchaeum sp.]|nr:cation-translocating P-type ATPase [Candidatus ainarchaeum sp.]